MSDPYNLYQSFNLFVLDLDLEYFYCSYYKNNKTTNGLNQKLTGSLSRVRSNGYDAFANYSNTVFCVLSNHLAQVG